ncbi:MAG TPA: DNA polymerase III subunit beta [Armatimonadota bacterium]|nr:DNA polymerase III subunit beta [Armatimonadota bacterium]
MRFTCTRANLLYGLQLAVRAAPSRTPLPILSNVLLHAAENQLTLTCYDQEVGVQVKLPATVENAGEATAPARLMAEVVGDLPEADVQVSEDDRSNLVLSCQTAEFSLAGLPAHDYPRFPDVGEENRMVLPAPMMREIIKQTIFAVSSDDSRPALTGIYFAMGEGKLVAVSTDTHRLCIKDAAPAEMAGDAQVIVPERALDQLARSVPADSKENIEFRISRTQALFQWKDITIVSRLIEGPFPHYERVLPKEYEKLLVAEREALQRAVRRTAIVARGERTNRLVLRAAGGTLQLNAESSGLGKAHEEVVVEQEGEEVELAFNCDYLLEVLGVIEAEKVRLEISGALTPCLIRADANADFRYILMPMQIA